MIDRRDLAILGTGVMLGVIALEAHFLVRQAARVWIPTLLGRRLDAGMIRLPISRRAPAP
jgi:hypothetical protein